MSEAVTSPASAVVLGLGPQDTPSSAAPLVAVQIARLEPPIPRPEPPPASSRGRRLGRPNRTVPGRSRPTARRPHRRSRNALPRAPWARPFLEVSLLSTPGSRALPRTGTWARYGDTKGPGASGPKTLPAVPRICVASLSHRSGAGGRRPARERNAPATHAGGSARFRCPEVSPCSSGDLRADSVSAHRSLPPAAPFCFARAPATALPRRPPEMPRAARGGASTSSARDAPPP